MDAIISKLISDYGDVGIVAAISGIIIVYLYKRIEALQKENTETLKAVLPLMEKFQNTMTTTINVLSKKGDGQ